MVSDDFKAALAESTESQEWLEQNLYNPTDLRKTVKIDSAATKEEAAEGAELPSEGEAGGGEAGGEGEEVKKAEKARGNGEEGKENVAERARMMRVRFPLNLS